MASLNKNEMNQISQSELNHYIFKQPNNKNETQGMLKSAILISSSENKQESSEEKYFQLKKLYDERLSSLYYSIQIIASKIGHDEILKTMKNDTVSNDFVDLRRKEIIDSTLYLEKEDFIKKQIDEIADLRSMLIMKQETIDDLKTKNNSIIEETQIKISKLQLLMNNDYQKIKFKEKTSKGLDNEINNLNWKYEIEITRMNEEHNLKCLKLNTELNRIQKDNNIWIDRFKV